MLQSHYGGVLDFSNDALIASEKGFKKLMQAFKILEKSSTNESASEQGLNEKITNLCNQCYINMNDDFNTRVAIVEVQSVVKYLKEKIDENNSEEISASVSWLSYHAGSILGLLPNDESIIDEINQKNAAKSAISDIVNDLLKQRTIARDNKNWQRADEIRSELNEMGVIVEDSPDGPIWRIK